MNYYALFLNTDGFIEQCLSLIRYICNPNSKSYPHITVRVYKTDHMGIETIINQKITYVNMIEAGAFDLEKNNPPYTVYIRFESEELEALDYKPDFPMSFMHLTLYDGNDVEFAKLLLSTLKTISWRVKLSFKKPLYLTTNAIGKKIITDDYLDKINDSSLEILNISRDELLYKCKSDTEKIKYIKKILEILQSYYTNNDNIDVPIPTYDIHVKVDKKNVDLFFREDSGQQIKTDAKNTIFVTPPEYAKEMAEIAFNYFDSKEGIYFGDSALGTGALFLALRMFVKGSNDRLIIKSAIGIEIDRKLALEAKRRYSGRGLEIVWGDSLLPQIEPYLEQKRNLMLVNPPYSRSGEIDPEYRKNLQRLAYNQTGIKVNGRTPLYVYHIMIMDKWLENNGIAVWLIPSIFIQTQYGKALRQYLLNNVRLLRIHLYPVERVQFEKAKVTTCLVVFKKTEFSDNDSVIFTNGDSIHCNGEKEVTRRTLMKEVDNWRNVLKDETSNYYSLMQNKDQNRVLFSDLFDIKRGLATGANNFFVMTEKKALERGIPQFALKPLLPKARYLSSTIIVSDEYGYPINNPHIVLLDCDTDEDVIKEEFPKFYKYLQSAKVKVNGKAIIDRTLVKSRKPWYKQENREVPLYLLTYMGRDKDDKPPLYFLLNRTKAIALNTYLCLYPKDWLQKILDKDRNLQVDLLNVLNLNAKYIVANQTRVYSGTFQKIEPNVLKQLMVIGLPQQIKEEVEKNVINTK